jgi:hypothetical protein
MWRVANETHGIEDGVEAVRNFLAGRDLGAAVAVASTCLTRCGASSNPYPLPDSPPRFLESLPDSHAGYAFVADEKASAHLALGQTG